jgi:hypothetical protein
VRPVSPPVVPLEYPSGETLPEESAGEDDGWSPGAPSASAGSRREICV